MEKNKHNKTLLVGKIFALVISLLAGSTLSTGTSGEGATNPNDNSNYQATAIPLVKEIKSNLTTANESPIKDESTD